MYTCISIALMELFPLICLDTLLLVPPKYVKGAIKSSMHGYSCII